MEPAKHNARGVTLSYLIARFTSSIIHDRLNGADHGRPIGSTRRVCQRCPQSEANRLP